MTPNQHLGDVPVTLIMENGNRVDFMLRPTPRATMEIERVFNRGILGVSMLVAAGESRTDQMAEILMAGIRAAGHHGGGFEMTAEKLHDPIWYTGYDKVFKACNAYLDACRNGGVTPETLKKSGASVTGKTEEEPTISLGGNGSDSPPSNSDGQSSSSGTAPGGPSSQPSSG